jgi:pimeloyl-ACP methyl ester carboxylesterase
MWLNRAARLCAKGEPFASLAFEEVASPRCTRCSPVVFLLHGLLGQARNWRSFAKTLVSDAEQRGADSRVVLVNLRHHGGSPVQPGDDTLDCAASDIDRLAAKVGSPSIVVGHSLGGKIALAWAAARPQVLPAPDVWLLDSSPGRVEKGDPHGTDALLATVRALPPSFASRGECTERLASLSPTLAAWLVSSLVPSAVEPGRLRFCTQLDGAARLYDDYKSRDLWTAVEELCASEEGVTPLSFS